MRVSFFFFAAAALPFGLAHLSVITTYVTVCEPSLSNGYTFAQAPTYAPGGSSLGEEGKSPAPSGGYGSGYGSVNSPGAGYGGEESDQSSTCTESGYGYGGYGGSGYHTAPGSGGHVSGIGSGHSESHTHSSYSFSNHSTTARSSTSTSSKNTPTQTTASYVPGCTNTADDRAAWCDGYSIDTNLDTTWPTTGKVRSYSLEITNTTLAPDGFERLILAINGQYPGPTIEADWGDTLEITVKNSLQSNGTSMHWHGLRQLNTNNMDGTNGITECPIAPGQSKTYKFLATQHGTSWYHSHFSAQYGDGVVGTILINGPATANYDEDLGTFPITDWYHTTVYQNALISTYQGGTTPTADNGLIDGKMLNSAGSGGSYSKRVLEKGKKYRLRLINTSVDNHFKVSLDGHPFQVITSDFVPIVPYTTQWIFMGIGQRYDVIITADQAISNYWFRAEVQVDCSSDNDNNGNIKAIFSYSGAATGNPTTTGSAYDQNCIDETTLVPRVKKNVPSAQFQTTVTSLVADQGSGVDSHGSNIITWTINGTPIDIDWDVPTLQYVANGETTFPAKLNVVKMPNKDQWYFWIIQATEIPISHPIHLHGHDFSLLGTGGNIFDPEGSFGSLNFENPPRRDVAMLPAAGWLAIAFEADNPGAWLMHCHIAWHVGQGFAAQFLEQETAIAGAMDLGTLSDTCDAWGKYQSGMVYPQDDSGL